MPEYFKARLWTFIPLAVLYFAIAWAGPTLGSLNIAANGRQATGTVQAVGRCQNSNGTPDGSVRLTVAFRDARGAQRVYRETSCYPYRFGVGHLLTVRYFSADPHQVATPNDVDRLAQRAVWVVGLLMAAALCLGALLFVITSDLRQPGLRGAALRVVKVAQAVAVLLIGLGGLGVFVCLIIGLNIHASADEQLGDPEQTATATALVIRVTRCDYYTGSSDNISGALALLARRSGANGLGPADTTVGEQPTVSFVDHAGLTQQMELDECDPLYRVGMQVHVTYLLTDPTRHYDDGPSSNGPNATTDNCLFTAEFIMLGAIVLGGIRWVASLRADALARRARPAPRRRA